MVIRANGSLVVAQEKLRHQTVLLGFQTPER